MPAITSPNRISRARPRAGDRNLARRSNRKVRSPAVVLSCCKPSKTRHPTRQRLCQSSTEYDRGQQYSIIAMTNGGGTITERYAYDAYGTPTITDASGTTLTASAENNRYTYTGREFDSELGLYHYRARMYDSVAGRFCSRDPIGYEDGFGLYHHYFLLSATDPSGEKSCWWSQSSRTVISSSAARCKFAPTPPSPGKLPRPDVMPVKCNRPIGSGDPLTPLSPQQQRDRIGQPCQCTIRMKVTCDEECLECDKNGVFSVVPGSTKNIEKRFKTYGSIIVDPIAGLSCSCLNFDEIEKAGQNNVGCGTKH